jgi:hypothetical protein
MRQRLHCFRGGDLGRVAATLWSGRIFDQFDQWRGVAVALAALAASRLRRALAGMGFWGLLWQTVAASAQSALIARRQHYLGGGAWRPG